MNVLKRDIISRFPARKGMIKISEHLPRSRPNIDLSGRHAERLHQCPGVAFGRVRGCKPGQRVGKHIPARQSDAIHGARRDDQRLGQIKPAGNADDGAFDARRREPGRQPLHLDVVSFVRVLA